MGHLDPFQESFNKLEYVLPSIKQSQEKAGLNASTDVCSQFFTYCSVCNSCNYQLLNYTRRLCYGQPVVLFLAGFLRSGEYIVSSP